MSTISYICVYLVYNIPLRDVVDLKPRGYRKLKRGNIVIRRPYLLRVLLYTWYTAVSQFFFFFLIIPFITFALLSSLPPSRNADPGSHSRLFSPPCPLRFVPCIFYRENISALSSLVDSRRIVLTHARRSQQLLILFFIISADKVHI